MLRTLTAFVISATFATLAHAHGYTHGDLSLHHPFARATAPKQPSAGAYVDITNKGSTEDKLVSASSPVAKNTEIHNMTMDNNVMKMRQVDGIAIAPSATVSMKPGHGYHIMLLGLQQQLKEGESFPMTLVFEKAGKIEVSVKVEAAGSKGHHDHDHHDDHGHDHKHH